MVRALIPSAVIDETVDSDEITGRHALGVSFVEAGSGSVRVAL